MARKKGNWKLTSYDTNRGEVMEILEICNLVKHYGENESLVKAVDNVNLKIKEGDFIAIVGSSGQGKSTFLHLVSGLDKPDSGKVYIAGVDIYKLNDNRLTKFRRKNIGFIYQFYNLIPVLTVKENIILPALLENNKYDKKHFDNLISILNLKERLNYLPNELSGGQQQRASIGRALINKPRILFADEPTGNLDVRSKKSVMKLLKYYNQKYNQTIIIVTHDMLMAKEAKKIIYFEDGKIKRINRACK